MNIDLVQTVSQTGLAGALVLVVLLWHREQKIWPKQLNSIIKADVESREQLTKAITMLIATVSEFHRTCHQTQRDMADTEQKLKAQVDKMEKRLEDNRG